MAQEVNGVTVNNEVIIAPLPAGTAQIGTVGLVAGTAQIGTVSLTAGSAAIGTVGVTGSVAVTGTFYQATQPVSGTVSLGAGSAAIGTVTLGAGSAAIGSVSVTGSVAVTSTTLATQAAQTAVQGSATGGTAATASQLDGGLYNSTAPTLTNGQQAALQLDAAGNLKVNIAVGGASGGGTQAVSIAAGQDVTEGNTTDAPLTGAASTTAATLVSVAKGQYNLLQAGTARVGLVAAAAYQSSTGASLAANTAAPTTTIQCGTSNTSLAFATIKATVMNPPSAGQIKPQYSNDGTNWADAGGLVTCAASAVTSTTSPVYGQYARWVYVNGSTALSSAVVILTSATVV